MRQKCRPEHYIGPLHLDENEKIIIFKIHSIVVVVVIAQSPPHIFGPFSIECVLQFDKNENEERGRFSFLRQTSVCCTIFINEQKATKAEKTIERIRACC